MRIFRTRRYRDHVTRMYGNAFTRDAQRALALQDDEHFFLRVVKVIRARHLARRHDVDRCAKLARDRPCNARTNHAPAA